MKDLTPRQRQILEFVDDEVRRRGYPPSVREIGKAVGLTSTSTVHAHLSAPVAEKGDIVVAGIPGEEATVKTFARKGDRIVLRPANAAMVDLVFRADEVTIYGKVVSLIRRY